MRALLASLIIAGGLGASLAPAAASETGPVIVIPGRPGVPVMLDGRDVSYSVIEGDWGLARPSQTDPVVIYRYGPPIHYFPGAARYYPSAGRPPRVGRKEVDMPSSNPVPAQTFIRSWGVQSDPTPATSPSNFEMPPVVVAPEGANRRPYRP
jgi:hypothetical protein